jgi:hypothetical protein
VSDSTASIGLKALLYAGGAVATAAGLDTAIRGARSLPGRARADAILDSELRYYAGFYAAYGLALVRLAPRAESEPGGVRAAAGALFMSGIARAAGWRQVGRPHPIQIGLLGLELGLPGAMVALSRRR